MPTYEYHCEKCDHTFEKVQSIKDNALTVCPKEDCPRKPWGKGKIKRVIGAGAGLLFKGSGFYITDYRDQAYKDKSTADTAATTPKTETTGDSKTDAKADTKTESKSETASKPDSKPSETKSAEPKPERKPEKASKSARKK
jgi:putative FmdB family regulatory protein